MSAGDPIFEATLPCYRRLKRRLGELDAVIELNETSLRNFLKRWKRYEESDYLDKQSKDVGIRVSNVNREIVYPQISSLYILSVVQQFELFTKEFMNEHKSAADWAIENYRASGESRLSWIMRFIGPTVEEAKCKIGKYEAETCEYYRLARNDFLHNGGTPKKASEKLLKALKEMDRPESLSNRIKGPNALNQLHFDDFILFSRSTKNVAAKICEVSLSNNERLIDSFLHLAEQEHVQGKEIESFLSKKLKGKKERQINAIESIIRSTFGVNDKTRLNQISATLLEKIQNGSLA